MNGQLFLKELNEFKVTTATIYHFCLYLLSALDLIVFKCFSYLRYVPQYFPQIYFRLCNKIKSSCPIEWSLALERVLRLLLLRVFLTPGKMRIFRAMHSSLKCYCPNYPWKAFDSKIQQFLKNTVKFVICFVFLIFWILQMTILKRK